MPVYDHRCRACGATFEVLRPHDAADTATACTCGATDSVRLPSLISRPTGLGDTTLPMASGGSGVGCCGGGACGCAR